MKRTKNHLRVKLFEWFRDNWTFHAKGMWISPKTPKSPTINIVGSSNFGYRSKHLDFEAQIYVATQNPALIHEFAQERDHLLGDSLHHTVTRAKVASRSLPLLKRMATPLAKPFC